VNKVAISFKGCPRPTWLSECRRFVRMVLKRLGLCNWELSILFCDDNTSQRLNAIFRHKDYPTDVLAFPQLGIPKPEAEMGVLAGDIVISLDRLRLNAKIYQVKEGEELKRLLVHGILHLAGYDHLSCKATEPMLQEQEKILSELKGERIF